MCTRCETLVMDHVLGYMGECDVPLEVALILEKAAIAEGRLNSQEQQREIARTDPDAPMPDSAEKVVDDMRELFGIVDSTGEELRRMPPAVLAAGVELRRITGPLTLDDLS